MGTGKIRSLVVRPIQSVDVAAERAGTIAAYHESVRLGGAIQGCLRAALLRKVAMADASGRMKNAAAVHALLSDVALVRIGNEEDGLELDAVVLEHHNRLLAGLADPPKLAATLAEFHRTKRDLLDRQMSAHKDKVQQLGAAYGDEGVVRQSKSIQTFANNVGQYSSVHLNPVAMKTSGYTVAGGYNPGGGK